MLHLDLHINNSLAQAAIIKALPCSDLFIQRQYIIATIIHLQRYTLTDTLTHLRRLARKKYGREGKGR